MALNQSQREGIDTRASGKRVVIYGVGNIARTVSEFIRKDSVHELAAFTVPAKEVRQASLLGVPVALFEEMENAYPSTRYAMFVALGYARVNEDRAEVYDLCKQRGYELITYVSSRSSFLGELEIGDNCLVSQGVVIEPFVKIGNNVSIWAGSMIGEHAQIGDHCFISPHAVLSGGVKVSSHCFMGANACLRDGITIASKSVIGAGAVILRNTRPKAVYAVKSTPQLSLDSTELRLR